MIHESAPKALNYENRTIQCAEGAPPHVPVGALGILMTSLDMTSQANFLTAASPGSL